jgi:hypothetical protein
MGLYYSGLNPGLYLCFETKAHADAAVKEGADYIKKNRHGKFHAHTYGFEFNMDDTGFKDFPNLYTAARQFQVKQLDGKLDLVDFDDGGDGAMNKVMLKFLVALLKPFEGYKVLKRENVFRVVIAMHNIELGKAWVVRGGTSYGRWGHCYNGRPR